MVMLYVYFKSLHFSFHITNISMFPCQCTFFVSMNFHGKWNIPSFSLLSAPADMDFQKTMPFAKPSFLPPVPFSPVLSHPFTGLSPRWVLFLPLFWLHVNTGIMGFPGGISGEESACQHRRYKRCVFNPWVRKIPWRRKWQHTPVFLPGEFHGQRSLGAKSMGSQRVRHNWATNTQTALR